MLKEEWKNLFRNKILLLVVIVIAIIPTIYAGLFLASMWDPYGSIDKLPVAVVNQDQPAEYKDTTLKVGDELVTNLKKNDSLSFNFVDQSVAEDGLRNGTYYMVITIPKDFSANAATVMDKEPKKMQLDYQTNPGTNYIASKLSETALSKIKSSITEEVTKTYAKAIFDQIGTAGDGMQEAADGAGTLKSGMDDASSGNQTITKNLKVLADSTLTFKSGSEELTKGIKDYTDGVAQVNQGAKKLDSGVSELSSKVPTLTSGTEKLNSGVKEYTNGVAKLNDNSNALLSGSSQIKKGGKQLKDGAASLNTGTKQYVSGVNTLADGLTSSTGFVNGVNTLAFGLVGDGTTKNPGYLNGVQQLANGASQLSGLEKLGDVSSGISKLNQAVAGTDNANSLKKGTEALAAGLKTMSEQVSALEGSTNEEGLKKLIGGLQSAKTGMQTASQGMTNAATGIESAASASKKAASVSSQVSQSISGLPDQLSTNLKGYGDVITSAVTDGMTGIATANAKMQKGRTAVDAVKQELASLKTEDGTVTLSEDKLKELIATLDGADQALTDVEQLNAKTYSQKADAVTSQMNQQLQAGVKQMNAAADGLNQIATGLNQGADSLKNGAKEMQAGASQMEAGAQQIPSDLNTDAIKQLSDGLKSAYNGSVAVNGGVAQVSEGLSMLEKNTASFPAAAQGIKTLNAGFNTVTKNNAALSQGAKKLQTAGKTVSDGATKLKKNGPALKSGASQLAGGTKTLAKGSTQLYSGIMAYTDGVGTLNNNSSALTAGTQQLADGAVTLGSGAKQLSDGTSSLYSGTKKLVSNNNTLNHGANQLTDGSKKIQSGSSQLYDGSKQLGDGLKKLTDGSDTLQSSLADGAKQVKDNKAEDTNLTMIAAPVTDNESKLTKVENNGHAMAPYMMSVGLWVGTMAFCLMYPLTKYKGELKSGFSWWCSKASVLYPLAMLQGILVIVLLHVFDGFTPVEMGKAIAFSCLTSIAFAAIMYFFNVALGKVGSFLMLVFMVVQLAGSAGTYPVEISPEFVSKIHAWVPFTYTVNAFRSVICGGESIKTSVIVMIALAVIFTILTILVFQFRTRRIRHEKRMFYDFLEEEGLA